MPETLKTRIAQLERRLSREKSARLAAEKLLDEYSSKFFVANEKLKQSLLVAQRKQEEIEYLARAGFSISAKHEPDTLIASTLGLTGDFCNAEYAVCFFTCKGKLTTKVVTSSYNNERGQYDALLQQLIPADCDELIDCWLIENISSQMARSCWAVSANFVYDNNTLGWLALIIPTSYIDEGLLYILDVYLKYLRTGLDQQLNTRAIDRTNSNMIKIQSELSETKQQLVVADRMAALGFLASGVAHEINNPTAFISSNNNSMKEMTVTMFDLFEQYVSAKAHSLDSKAAEIKLQLDDIKEEIFLMLEDNEYGVGRILAISENLRSYSHFGEQLSGEVDLNGCIDNMLKVASTSLPSGVKLVFLPADELQNLTGNAGQIEQVILNLIVNAIDAVDGKGDVVICTYQTATTIALQVKDSGQGMDETVKKKLFSPFFTTKDVGKGTGLGLSISQNIVDAHGGRIEVDSVLGEGTCFNVHFPISTCAKDE